jgi:hypothetical protein
MLRIGSCLWIQVVPMSDDEEENLVACDEQRKLGGAQVDGDGVGHTPQAARTDAANNSEQAAIDEAFKEAADLVCDDACPIRRLWLHVARPKVGRPQLPAPPAAQIWTAQATCAWRGTFRCMKPDAAGAEHKEEIPAEPQRFTCDDPLTIIAEGYAEGKSVAPQPATAQEGLALVAAVAADLDRMLRVKVRDAVQAFECPTVKCKNKEVRITRWPPSALTRGRQVPPPPPNAFEWTSQAWYRVEARCE